MLRSLPWHVAELSITYVTCVVYRYDRSIRLVTAETKRRAVLLRACCQQYELALERLDALCQVRWVGLQYSEERRTLLARNTVLCIVGSRGVSLRRFALKIENRSWSATTRLEHSRAEGTRRGSLPNETCLLVRPLLFTPVSNTRPRDPCPPDSIVYRTVISVLRGQQSLAACTSTTYLYAYPWYRNNYSYTCDTQSTSPGNLYV